MGPIRGQTRPLPVMAEIAPEVQRIDAKLNASIHNRFDVEVIDSATGEVRQRAQAENVITNTLWSTGIGQQAWADYIWYGSGSGTPAAGDTALFTPIAAAKSTYVGNNYDIVNRFYSAKFKIVLSETTAVGKTITEVGCSYTNSSGYLCTHAMLTDMNGNIISIAKTGTDIINIYATTFVHWSEDIESKIIFPSYFMAPFCGNYTNGSFCSVKSYALVYSQVCPNTENTTSSNFNGSVSSSYANKVFTVTCSRIPAGYQNFGSLRCIAMLTTDAWYYAIPISGGSDIKSEPIGTGDGSTKDFVTDFAMCSNATIFLNGVAETGVTVDTGYPFVNGSRYLCSGILEDIEFSGSTVKSTTTYNTNWKVSSSGITAIKMGTYNYYRNIYAGKVDLAYFYHESAISEISVSNDLVTWVNVSGYSSSNYIPLAYRAYKYIRVMTSSQADFYPVPVRTSDNNIHFNAAPPSGAVITADYHTDCIAKDVNHVFDFSMMVQLGEYTG